MPLNHVVIQSFSERGDYFTKKSLFAKFYEGSDLENIAEKQSTALGIGMTGVNQMHRNPIPRTQVPSDIKWTGLALGLVSVLFKPDLIFKELLASQKRWTFLQVAKGTLIGGISACTYIGTAQYIGSYRKKDDWVNHYVGGYAGILPYTIMFSKDWRYFMMGGTIVGVMCALAKMAAQSEFLPTMEKRQDRLGQTKYPEIYVFQQTQNDIRKMKAEGLNK